VVVVVVVRVSDTRAGEGTRGVPRLSGEPDEGNDDTGLVVVAVVRGVDTGEGDGAGVPRPRDEELDESEDGA
jgi:hypothetical protein